MSGPCESEHEVLQMVAGEIPWERGAWVNAAFEFLQEDGYITSGLLTKPQLTEKGKEWLAKSL